MSSAVARRDGPLKVTGQALYTAELQIPGAVHGVLVGSPIASGRVLRIESSEASACPGVIAVQTHETFARLTPARTLLDPGDDNRLNANGAGKALLPMQDERVYYRGQPIALVLAETLEAAQRGAELIEVRLESATPKADMLAELPHAFSPGKEWSSPADVNRGDLTAGLAESATAVAPTYFTAIQHHNTMEPHATVAFWQGERLTIYEPSTWVAGVQKTVAAWFQIAPERIHVLQPFVGGSFGSKGPTWPHVAIAVAAARDLKRPVKIVLSRPQTYTGVGYRPRIRHSLQLAARRDGALTAIAHHALAQTSMLDHRVVAPVTKTTRKLYACANCATTYRLVNLNLPGPFTMRGPGETPGLYALESAMDELAYALRLDPVALRLRNDAPVSDPETGKPWSSRSLRACLEQGAERFGWSERHPEPRSVREHGELIGMGMASMAYDAKIAKAAASVRLGRDGSVIVRSSTTEQGTGSYTIMCQIAADALQVPVKRVRFELGDTDFPLAPISAGSQTTASVGSAIRDGCAKLRDKLASLRRGEEDDGALLARNGLDYLEAQGSAEATEAHEQHVCYSFGAHFAEVGADEELGRIRVRRYVGAFAAGRIVNSRTAHSQLLGGIVWGIGMALMEGTWVDTRLGAFVNTNLAEYHIPTNSDVPAIDAFFIREDDPYVNPLGVKGVGEIGTVGAAAAIGNAVYDATGKRIRELPITPDKLL